MNISVKAMYFGFMNGTYFLRTKSNSKHWVNLLDLMDFVTGARYSTDKSSLAQLMSWGWSCPRSLVVPMMKNSSDTIMRHLVLVGYLRPGGF